ncbi:unnamed protein product [Phaedon cochleariae]|uniref:ZP domain-containing protein n=1 Tax=Phaedon cochleariae TaxID=80249 RepID=A0A9P0DRI5_PHACE|nr:unnamed protein product [Phaedon cochleariae]
MRYSTRHLRRVIAVPSPYIIFFINLVVTVSRASDLWPLARPDGMPAIQSLEVMCGKDHMDVHLSFSRPFEGIVSSKGQHGDPRCVYVPPASGQTVFSFRIAYARCGTKPDLHGQFYENTVVVQYDQDLLEVWDEAKRLRCEWFDDYEKTASKPPMVIADLDVVQLDFRGDNVDCWMEIQHGKGPWAPPVSGIVPLGSTLTLVVAINDYRSEFDMRVKSCLASDGAGHVIQLSDEFGCVVRPKMISRFLKARGADERASVITYAFFHAFKFPDALSVHIKCKVEICRRGCLDHCQLQEDKVSDIDMEHYADPLERKDVDVSSENGDDRDIPASDLRPPNDEDVLYEDIIHDATGDDSSVKLSFDGNSIQDRRAAAGHYRADPKRPDGAEKDLAALPHQEILPMPLRDKFPSGPRTFGQPRNLDSPQTASTPQTTSTPQDTHTSQTAPNTTTPPSRRRRSVTVSDRRARSADVGVSSLYDVISEADLAFSPDGRPEAVAVFQGRIREEVVYGVCMPVPGFSLLFVLVAVSAVVSALVAGSLLYRYQIQRERLAEQVQDESGSIPLSAFSNWIGFRLLRKNCVSVARHTGCKRNGDAPMQMRTVVNGKAANGACSSQRD